jgi:hypothetical protein
MLVTFGREPPQHEKFDGYLNFKQFKISALVNTRYNNLQVMCKGCPSTASDPLI